MLKILKYEPELIFIHETKNTDINKSSYDVNKLHELGYYENYFIKTHTNGCTFDDYICVKGPKYGKNGSYKDGADYFSIDEYEEKDD